MKVTITAWKIASPATPLQEEPGTIEVEIAIAKASGDHRSEAQKPRWIASSMRRLRISRTSTFGSRLAMLSVRPPSSVIEP